MFLSPSFSLPSLLSKKQRNKIFFLKKKVQQKTLHRGTRRERSPDPEALGSHPGPSGKDTTNSRPNREIVKGDEF